MTIQPKNHIFRIASLAAILLVPAAASAHVIVTPGQVGIGQELVFNVSVPNEQQTPVVDLKLTVPSGVTDVTPTAAPGWTIKTTSTGDNITQIEWTGSIIAVGQREDFSFGATAPAAATELDWKAYQTYGDGTVVHWDQKPAGSDDATGNAGPYSVTHVVNDLTASATTKTSSNTLPLALSIAALVISVGGILVRRRSR